MRSVNVSILVILKRAISLFLKKNKNNVSFLLTINVFMLLINKMFLFHTLTKKLFSINISRDIQPRPHRVTTPSPPVIQPRPHKKKSKQRLNYM